MFIGTPYDLLVLWSKSINNLNLYNSYFILYVWMSALNPISKPGFLVKPLNPLHPSLPTPSPSYPHAITKQRNIKFHGIIKIHRVSRLEL